MSEICDNLVFKARMDQIIKLLEDYKEYTEQGMPKDLGLFGEWLKQKYAGQEAYLTDEEEVNEAGLDAMASYVLGGLTNYVEAWVKLTYQDLPIVSLGDFGILKTVEFLQNPTKKMISDQVIMERTTCNESVKRLVKEGLLSEATDPKDRRMKRVQLTARGRDLIQILNQKMIALGKLLMGNLNEVEKKSLLPPLKKLADFHEVLYRQTEREKVKEWYGL